MRLNDALTLQSVTAVKLLMLRRHGLPVTVEHPRGTLRELKNDQGKVVYRKHMTHHYGFIAKTIGRDGDEVDVIVGPLENADEVFIVHMIDLGPDKDQREDEDKCMIGFPSADAAKAAFLSMYPKTFYGGMTALPVATFKKKLKTASLPYHKRKIAARSPGMVSEKKCPNCGSTNYSLMPTDYETARCNKCRKLFEA